MTAKPSVLFVNYTPLAGGDTVVLKRIVLFLAEQGYHVGVASPENPWLEDALAGVEISARRVAIPKLEKFRNGIAGYLLYIVRAFRAVWGIRAVIRTGGWDIVHVNTLPNICGVAAALTCGKPLVWHIHEIMFESRMGFRLLSLLPRRLARVVLCPSKAVMSVFSGPGTRLLRNVLPDDWASLALTPAGVRERHDIAPDARVLLWVGSIEPRKGLGILLEALDSVRNDHGEPVLLVVCRISKKYRYLYKEAEATARDCRYRTVFVENVSDPRPYYAVSDILLQTSILPEAFGLTVLEAAAFGKPIICSGKGGITDFAVHGETAHVVHEMTPSHLADAISLLLDDDEYCGKIGRGAKEKSTAFSVSRVLPELEEVYGRLRPGIT